YTERRYGRHRTYPSTPRPRNPQNRCLPVFSSSQAIPVSVAEPLTGRSAQQSYHSPAISDPDFLQLFYPSPAERESILPATNFFQGRSSIDYLPQSRHLSFCQTAIESCLGMSSPLFSTAGHFPS